ncbi:hypothetical protein PVAP13_2NG382200 [Panicum virgatum]|uniref:Uncharacterized protein n=1 Tax=Panicum virgatum TaxID=38727 RepID=A0A8T0VTB5_PANVG|nr:hypothetical protein PVAP13_2NG382200 [Panicum virgatum]
MANLLKYICFSYGQYGGGISWEIHFAGCQFEGLLGPATAILFDRIRRVNLLVQEASSPGQFLVDFSCCRCPYRCI